MKREMNWIQHLVGFVKYYLVDCQSCHPGLLVQGFLYFLGFRDNSEFIHMLLGIWACLIFKHLNVETASIIDLRDFKESNEVKYHGVMSSLKVDYRTL